jgi:hypothetical protein
VFLPRPTWVLSGSLDGWGAEAVALFDLVVFVRTPVEIRLQRLRAREARHFGADAVAPGGWHRQDTEDFIEWASHYEDGTREGRHLARHLRWLEGLACPVVEVDGARPIADLVQDVVAALERPSFRADRAP